MWLRALNKEQCLVTYRMIKITLICCFDDFDNLLIPKKHWQHFLAWKTNSVHCKLSGLCPEINKHITTLSSSTVLRPIQLDAGLSTGAECSACPHVWRWSLWRVELILVGTLRRSGTEKPSPHCLLKLAQKLLQINTFLPNSTVVYWSFDFFQRTYGLQ